MFALSRTLAMNENWSPLDGDVLLKGTLTVVVYDRRGQRRAGERVLVRGCGFM
jgi:hypothetical protein